MSAAVPPVRRYSVSAIPASWKWTLAAGYYELTLTPASPESARFALSFADFSLKPLRTRSERAETIWPLFVPSSGTWEFSLTGSDVPPEPVAWKIAATRVPFVEQGPSWKLPPRGMQLDGAPEGDEPLERWLAEAVARGVSFVFGPRQRLEDPAVRKVLKEKGLLAVCAREHLPSPVAWEGRTAGDDEDASGGWRRGGSLSPLAEEALGAERDGAVGWWHHVTTNGVLTLKHAAWSDLAEIWYHPHGGTSGSPAQELFLARLRGVGTEESRRAIYPGNVVSHGWQTRLPPFAEAGLLHLRWPSGQVGRGSTVLRANTQALGRCIPMAASGDLYCPWFPDPDADTPTVLGGVGTSPPEAIDYLRSRLAVRLLWRRTIGPGRHQWPRGIHPLTGYEQPSRTRNVLAGLRFDPHPDGSLLLAATVEVRSRGSIEWSASCPGEHGAADEPSVIRSEVNLERGTHRVLIPLPQNAGGSSFLLTGPRRTVRLRSLAVWMISVCASARAGGPYWSESEIASVVLADGQTVGQRWSVRMVRGQPWLAMTASTSIPPTCLSFELPRHDQLLVNSRPLAGTGSMRRAIRLIVLKDSSGTCPNIALIPIEENTVWTVRQVGTTLAIESSDGAPCSCVVSVGRLDRWGGAAAVRRGSARLIRTVSLTGQTAARVKNGAAKGVAVLARIEPTDVGPYWVSEGGWWRRVESQRYECGEVHAVLVPLRIPGKSSVLLARGIYLYDSVRPSPGSQHSLLLSEPEREGVVARVMGPSPFDAPLGVEFRYPFVSVTCNGRPWHVHDGGTVWLPANDTYHWLRVSAAGARTPTIIEPRLPIVATRWTGARLTVRLATTAVPSAGGELLVCCPCPDLVWLGVEGGAGSVEAQGVIRVRPTAQTVHIRFVRHDAVRTSR